MERTNLEIPVSREAVEHGFKLGLKVYQDKLKFPDKFRLGGAGELQADIFGFIAECVVCEYFKQPFPAFTPKKNDAFDVKIKGLRIDVKKVGYSNYSKQPKITLNKRQFDRKKDKIDAFLFCTFKGAFDQKENILGYQVTYPLPELSRLALLGWEFTSNVELKGKTYLWKNRDGSPRDESWELRLNQLKDIRELVSVKEDVKK